MTLGERRAVIERDGKEAWKWLEWSAMKVRFAKEVLQAAEGDHERRKVAFDALAAALEENNEETRRVDEKIKKLEGTLGAMKRNVGGNVGASASANRGGAPRFPSDIREPQPASSNPATGRRAAVAETAANASFEVGERRGARETCASRRSREGEEGRDVDHLRDGHGPAATSRNRSSRCGNARRRQREAPRVSDRRRAPLPRPAPRHRARSRRSAWPPPTSPFFDAVVGGSPRRRGRRSVLARNGRGGPERRERPGFSVRLVIEGLASGDGELREFRGDRAP